MKHEAIYNTHPSVVTIRGDNCFDADDNPVTLDQAKVDAEVARLQAEYDSKAYARLRKAEYPSIEECVHAILDDDLVALQAKRAEIKARYPK
ncbi:MAG: hypothetical protein QF535_24240 [Anaerolineales bacterium]|jgi:hypothetical protein|nr:hypothetical protein [Anaerolineales bacterium]|tara:strand:+ start:643 stop:918 length:276 start_codon:yes stop_codon:yes gene_type:complete